VVRHVFGASNTVAVILSAEFFPGLKNSSDKHLVALPTILYSIFPVGLFYL
jgi:hypothetical protein